MAEKLPPEREVVSYTHGADIEQQIYLLKFRLRNGVDEVLHFPSIIAFHLLDSVQRAILHHSYPMPPTDSRFQENEPNILSGDWGQQAGGAAKQAHGLEVHSFADNLCLAVLIDPAENIYKALRLPAAIVGFLPLMIEEARSGGLIDLRETDNSSAH